jgi:hypothetical protein
LIMVLMRTLVSLLASLAVAATIVATVTIWRVLHDPLTLTPTLGNVLVPIVEGVGHAIVEVARRL